MKTLYPSLSNRNPLSRLDDIFLTTWSEAVPTWSGMHRHLRSESLVHYNVTITQDQDPGMTLKQRLAFYKWSASRVSKSLCEGTDKMWIYKFCWHYVLGYIWTIVYCFLYKRHQSRMDLKIFSLHFFVFFQSRTGCVDQWKNNGPAWERNIAYRQASQGNDKIAQVTELLPCFHKP